MMLSLLVLLATGCINLPLGLFGNNRGKVSLEIVEPASGDLASSDALVRARQGALRAADITRQLLSFAGRDSELRQLPRTPRPARRPAPHGRVLRDLPQPGFDGPGRR